MSTELSFIRREQVAPSLRRLMKIHDHFYWAVAWGSDNPALADLLHHFPKIKTLVIGTSFYQTPPDFLEQFKTVKAARVNAPDGATFHPKAYLFVSGKHAAALIGSANFTKSAMASNAEACCLIQGDAGDDFFRELKAFVTVDCWNQAETIDEDFLRAYRIQHEATKAARSSLHKFVPLKRPARAAGTIDPLEMDWAGFVNRVRRDKYCLRRLDVLSAMKDLFARAQSFADLEEKERKAIAATLGKNQEKPHGLNTDLDWGMFGNMAGFGVFRALIKDEPQSLSDALDCIPPTGAVTGRDYDRFVALFQRSFSGKSRTGGAPSASRLLAMKRPDYFVCFDIRNQKGICAHFGLTVNSIDLKTYWSGLIERIKLSAWWNAPRPVGRDGTIWDGRAALLDALFYDHT